MRVSWCNTARGVNHHGLGRRNDVEERLTGPVLSGGSVDTAPCGNDSEARRIHRVGEWSEGTRRVQGSGSVVVARHADLDGVLVKDRDARFIGDTRNVWLNCAEGVGAVGRRVREWSTGLRLKEAGLDMSIGRTGVHKEREALIRAYEIDEGSRAATASRERYAPIGGDGVRNAGCGLRLESSPV